MPSYNRVYCLVTLKLTFMYLKVHLAIYPPGTYNRDFAAKRNLDVCKEI